MRRASSLRTPTQSNGTPPSLAVPKIPVKRSLSHFGYPLPQSNLTPPVLNESTSSLVTRGSSIFDSVFESLSHLPMPPVISSGLPTPDEIIRPISNMELGPPSKVSIDKDSSSSTSNTHTDSFSFGLSSPRPMLTDSFSFGVNSTRPSIERSQSLESLLGPPLEVMLSDLHKIGTEPDQTGSVRSFVPSSVVPADLSLRVNEHGLTNDMNPWYDPDTGTINYEAYTEYMSEAFRQPVTIIPDYPSSRQAPQANDSGTGIHDIVTAIEPEPQPHSQPQPELQSESQPTSRKSPHGGIHVFLNARTRKQHIQKNQNFKNANPRRLRNKPSVISRLRGLLKK